MEGSEGVIHDALYGPSLPCPGSPIHTLWPNSHLPRHAHTYHALLTHQLSRLGIILFHQLTAVCGVNE